MGDASPLSSVPILLLLAEEYQTLSAALASAEAGWELYPIYPVDGEGVCTCSKREQCPDPGKHPMTPNGFNDASSNPERIYEMFAPRPGANVGLLTGGCSRTAVLDIDPRHGGMKSLKRLQAEHGDLPGTRAHATGGGGYHFAYAFPEGVEWLPSKTLAPGVELKADGAGVVLPPSGHASGGVYSILSAAPLAPLPAWVLKRALAPELRVHEGGDEGQATSLSESRFEIPARISKGTRNWTLYRYGCSLRAHGWDHAAILAELRRANEERCQPPLEDSEVRKIAQSAASYALGNASTITPEVLEALDGIEAAFWNRPWPGVGGKSERSVMVALIKTARRHGTLIPAGVRVSIATRSLAELAQMLHRTLMRAVRRLRHSGVIRKDDADRRLTEAGAFVLVFTRAWCHHSTTPLGPPRSRVSLERQSPRVMTPCAPPSPRPGSAGVHHAMSGWATSAFAPQCGVWRGRAKR